MKISLITTCFNASGHIAEAIASAQRQGFPDLEHIVADAASRDGTLEILARYPHLSIDSRVDRGIYDGLNRGIGMASGDIIGFLNADDRLEPHALESVAEAFAVTPELDMLTGAARVFGDTSGREIIHIPDGQPSIAGMLFGVPVLNARFFARRFIERVGLFNLELPAAADRAWLVRVVTANPKAAHTTRVLYAYRAHAGSLTLAGSITVGPRLWREHLALADSLIGNPSTPPEARHIVHQWRAVEAAKLALRGDAGHTSRFTRLRQLVRSETAFPRRLSAGLLQWRKWRGRHADGRV